MTTKVVAAGEFATLPWAVVRDGRLIALFAKETLADAFRMQLDKATRKINGDRSTVVPMRR